MNAVLTKQNTEENFELTLNCQLLFLTWSVGRKSADFSVRNTSDN